MDDFVREFMAMAEDGDVEGVKSYLKLHVNVNIRENDAGNRTALMAAASGGRLEVIDLLLEHGAALELQDSEGKTALVCAIEYGKIDAVKKLLERGANPDASDPWSKWTGLMYASIEGKREIVELLLAHGVNPHATDSSGFTAHHYAKLSGHVDVAALLPDPMEITDSLDKGHSALIRLRRKLDVNRQVVR